MERDDNGFFTTVKTDDTGWWGVGMTGLGWAVFHREPGGWGFRYVADADFLLEAADIVRARIEGGYY